jgi:hypothetical protein
VPDDDRTRWRSEMSTRVTLLESVPRAGPVRTTVTTAAQEAAAEDGADAAPIVRTAEPVDTRADPSGGPR